MLDEAGARIVAADLGVERADLRWRHDAALGVASSAKLAHQVAANDFFTSLADQARAAGGALTEWYGDRTTHDLLAGVVVPDGYGVLELPGRPTVHLLLELDRGTEPQGRLMEKARGYAKALPRSTLHGLDPTILVAVPNTARAATAAQALGSIGPRFRTVTWTPERADSTLPQLLRALRLAAT